MTAIKAQVPKDYKNQPLKMILAHLSCYAYCDAWRKTGKGKFYSAIKNESGEVVDYKEPVEKMNALDITIKIGNQDFRAVLCEGGGRNKEKDGKQIFIEFPRGGKFLSKLSLQFN